MTRTFRSRLFTKQRLEDVQTVQALWRLLDDPLIEPLRFDAFERPKLPFRADAAEEAGLIYKKKSVLFVEGGKDAFLAVFDWQRPGLATWDFWLDVAAMQDGRQRSWLNWIFRLCAE